MNKRFAPLLLSSLTVISVSACADDSGDSLPTTSSGTFTDTAADGSSSGGTEAGDASSTSAGDGDAGTSGDGDTTTSSGDGDTTTSSGDGDSTSAGDGDTTTSSGDGDSTTSGDGDSTTSGDGDSTTSGDGDSTSTTGAGTPCADTVTMVVRDFSENHPDFQHPPWPEPWGPHAGVVEQNLGVDGKPVLVTPINITWQFSSEANFNQWYNTDPSPTNPYNYEFTVELPLTDEGNGTWSYESNFFHPIGPNDGFGSEGYVEQEGPDTGQPFNWHFTTETSFVFKYQGGEVFTFVGDDDFWGFINGKLVIDLGGIHGAASQSVDLDSHPLLGDLVVGQDYEVKLFHAERRHWGSNFRMETSQFCLLPE